MKADKAKGEGESEEGEKKKRLHFYAFLDKTGRILVPLRDRREAGIEGIGGAEVEVTVIIKKVYEKKESEKKE